MNRPGPPAPAYSSNFGRSNGAAGYATEKPVSMGSKVSGRSGHHARSKSQMARPRTAQGTRYGEDEPERSIVKNGTASISSFSQSLPSPPSTWEHRKVRGPPPSQTSSIGPTGTRESSLCTRSKGLSIGDRTASNESQVISRPPSRIPSCESIRSGMSNVTVRRPEKAAASATGEDACLLSGAVISQEA